MKTIILKKYLMKLLEFIFEEHPIQKNLREARDEIYLKHPELFFHLR